MSASIPNPGVDEEAPDRRWLWLGLSVLAHGAVLAWLVYGLTPARLLQPAATADGATAAAAASAHLVREVAAQIEQAQAEDIRPKVEELLATQKTLDALAAKTDAETAALGKELAVAAPERVADALDAAMKAQELAVQAQAEAVKARDAAPEPAAPPAPAPGTHKETAPDPVSVAQAKAKDAQTAATAAQLNASQQLGFLDGKDFSAARQSQSAAAAAQAEANDRQDEAAARQGELANLRRAVERAETAQAHATRVTGSARERIASKTAAIDRLTHGLEALEKGQSPVAAVQAKRQAAADALRKKIDAAATDLKKSNESLAGALKAEAEAGETAKTTSEALASAPAKAQAAQQAALAAQQKARSLQAEAQATVARATTAAQTAAGNAAGGGTAAPATGSTGTDTTVPASVSDAGAATKSSAATTAAATTSPEAPPAPADATAGASLEGLTFAQLYARAVEAQKQIDAAYRQVRAGQVAVQRQIPLDQAKQYVESVQTQRADFKAIPPEQISNAQALEARNAAMQQALQEIDSMLALSRNMADQAGNTASTLGGTQGVAVSVDALQSYAAQNQELASYATEAEGKVAADLTGLMKQMEAATAAAKGGAAGSFTGNGSGAAGGGAGSAGGGGIAQSPDVGGAGGSQGAGAGRGSAGGGGIGGYSGAGLPQGFPAPGGVMDSVPGRKVHGSDYTVGAKWMYVDSWYVIGPFPNPQRRNIDVSFPPESVVDLDAVYPSEDGEPLRWKFVENHQPSLHPPRERSYAIYYAWTTLWFAEERDQWIALGSDDFSKLWINGMMVWASGPQQKVWRANEGYRKVHFQKGLNRVLLRVENGQNACMFSLMLNMASNPQ